MRPLQAEHEAASALIITLAHDLRVPLRSIVMTAQQIQRRHEDLSVETGAQLDQILAAARRQDELIAGAMEYEQALRPGLAGDTPLALGLAIRTAWMKVDAYRQIQGGSISFDSDSAPRVLVPSGIAQVVAKVLHNGLKFHFPESSPKVHAEATEDSAGLVTILVRDNGIGIDEEYREAVFEPFKKLNSTSQYPGSGLGLSICRRLLASISGTIRIDEDIGTRGTSVVLSFPKVDAGT